MTQTVWGPKVWRLLHLLTAISDRRDIALLWLSILRATAEVLPCAICRNHMSAYLRSHVFFRGLKLHLVSAKEIQAQIMKDINDFHNDVNRRLHKKIFTYEDSAATTVGSREQLLAEAKSIYEELKLDWKEQKNLIVWTKPMSLMLALLQGGPN